MDRKTSSNWISPVGRTSIKRGEAIKGGTGRQGFPNFMEPARRQWGRNWNIRNWLIKIKAYLIRKTEILIAIIAVITAGVVAARSWK